MNHNLILLIAKYSDEMTKFNLRQVNKYTYKNISFNKKKYIYHCV